MAPESLTLPFEVTYSEQPGEKSQSMRRLAVLVKPEKVDDVIATLTNSGLEATIYDVRGATKGRANVSSGKGTGSSEVSYNPRKLIATVVKSEDVKAVVETIKKALGGSKAVVMVTSVEELVML